MKSLLISGTYFPPQVGGISHYMEAISSTLGAHRVCCLTGVSAGDGARGQVAGPRIYRCPAVFAQSNFIQAVGGGAIIAQIMVQERPRAVQLATVGECSLGLWLHQWLNLPFVVYAHGNEILAAMQNNWRKPRLALQQAVRVLANSRFTANLVQQVGVDPGRIEIVHPGCDTSQFRPLPPNMKLREKLLGLHAKDKVILTVGGLVARKGHDMVIRALPRVLQSLPDVTYLIVGDGPDRGRLETLAAAAGVRERVVFANQVLDEDLPDVYALSDVFVMASRVEAETCNVEGFGLVFLEANACGKPVVGGRSAGIPDAIVEGETGFLVNPHDPEEIAHALIQLLSDNELAIRLGEHGRLRVARDFTWAQVGDRVQGILDAAVQKQSTRIGR